MNHIATTARRHEVLMSSNLDVRTHIRSIRIRRPTRRPFLYFSSHFFATRLKQRVLGAINKLNQLEGARLESFPEHKFLMIKFDIFAKSRVRREASLIQMKKTHPIEKPIAFFTHLYIVTSARRVYYSLYNVQPSNMCSFYHVTRVSVNRSLPF